MYHGSLISLFFCLQMVTGKFQAHGPNEALVAMLGGDAELPCFLMHHQSIKNMKISWTRSLPAQVVHLYEDGKDKPEETMEEYYGRTELVKNVMHKGIVVLRIFNVRPSDSGQYRCAFQHGYFYSDTVIELKVAALGSHPKFHVEVTKSCKLRLECKSEGWFPLPKVQWMDSEGREIPAESETHTQDKGDLFHVTTSLVLREPSQKNLICSIWNPVLNQKKEEQLSIAVVEPINTTVISVVTSLAALLIMLISIGLYLLNNRLKNRSKNRSGKHQHDTHHCICQAVPLVTRDYAAAAADHVEFYAESNPEGASANAPGPAILAHACVAAINPDQDGAKAHAPRTAPASQEDHNTSPDQDGARAHAPRTAPASQEDHNTSPDQDSASADPLGTVLGNAAMGAGTPKATNADLDPEATCTHLPGTAPAAQEDHTTNPDQDRARADPPGAALHNAAPKATIADLDPEATCTYPPGAAPAEAYDTLHYNASKAPANFWLLSKYDPKKKAELPGSMDRFTGLSIGPYLQKGLKGNIQCKLTNKLQPDSISRINHPHAKQAPARKPLQLQQEHSQPPVNPGEWFQPNDLLESHMRQGQVSPLAQALAKTKGLLVAWTSASTTWKSRS